MSPDLKALQDRARAEDAEAVRTATPPQAPADPVRTEAPPAEPSLSLVESVRTFVEWLGRWLSARWPKLSNVWTKPRRDEVTDKSAKVLAKHGVELPAFLQRWRLELQLLWAWAALIWETLQVIKARDAGQAAGDAKAEAAPVQPAPAASSVVVPDGVKPLEWRQ